MAEQKSNNRINGDEIDIFLEYFGLSSYDNELRSSGLENLQIICELQEDDINDIINDINIKKRDIEKFKNGINSVKNGTYNPNKIEEYDNNKQETEFKYKKIEYNNNNNININDDDDIKNNKTIIFIGESGVGKTTVINSMCNYLYNVKYNDTFRYKLIYEIENEENKTQSQTQKINKYYLNSQDFISQINYSLTIIDTPGFGNIENDTIIQTQFKKCFNDIKFIDAVYFVVKSTDTRLSDAQKYIVNKLLNLFDDGFRENIFILFTFSDDSDPPAVKPIQKLNIKYNKYFKINNSGFALPENNSKNNTRKMFFDLAIQQFKNIFDELNHVKPVSTKEIAQNIEIEIRYTKDNNTDGSNTENIGLLNGNRHNFSSEGESRCNGKVILITILAIVVIVVVVVVSVVVTNQ